MLWVDDCDYVSMCMSVYVCSVLGPVSVMYICASVCVVCEYVYVNMCVCCVSGSVLVYVYVCAVYKCVLLLR